VWAPSFFALLYDSRYAGAGQLARWLSVFVWTWMLVASLDRLPLALGRPRTLFVANLAQLVGIPLSLAGYRYAGLNGFIIGMAAAQFPALAVVVFSLPSDRVRALRQSAVWSAAMAAYFWGAGTAVGAVGEALVTQMLTASAVTGPLAAATAVKVWRALRPGLAASPAAAPAQVPARGGSVG
jgi:O-antigen/teichoic acid export membrane protein